MKDVLYVTGFTQDKIPLLGGLWKMKTQIGFPLEMSWLECKERGFCPDWAELLADAGSVDLPAWEFDYALSELNQFIPGLVNEVYDKFKVWFMLNHTENESFSDTCKKLLEQKNKSSQIVEEMKVLNDLLSAEKE